jgi:peptidoglycan/LPS O-acetylase OafA/YrhL
MPINKNAGYRPDIDGLRAIAVVPVVLFHFHGARFVPGGFVGVDIFFVISGFLITKILHDEIQTGAFGVLSFYSRRVRRIFPALFAMISFCILSTAATGFPADASALSHDVVATIFSVSNIDFYRSSGYFDSKMLHNPLLHTWSLAVEEQFYVGFPLLLYALRNSPGRRRILVLSAIVCASLAWSVWMVHADQTAAFYLMPSRAWELLIGSLLAINAVPSSNSRAIANTSGIAGLLLIGFSIMSISESTPFPGVAAIAPCLGTAMVIHSATTRQTLVSKVMSIPPLRFIGLISYSLYLWHWPIFVVYSDVMRMPRLIDTIGLLVTSFFIAWLSYMFVERPFRRVRVTRRKGRDLAWAATAMVAMCAISVAASLVTASLTTLPPKVKSTLAFADYDAYASMRVGHCFLTSTPDDNRLYDSATCLAQRHGKMNVLLLGDSHAADLWPGFSAVRKDINFLQATASGCKPVLHSTGSPRCTELMTLVFKKFLPSNHLDAIILSARWAEKDAQSARETAHYLSQYADKVIVLGPTAEFDQVFPRLLARSLYEKDPQMIFRHERQQQRLIDAKFSEVFAGNRAQYISTYKALCDNECRIWADEDTPMYFDDNHLTALGAQVLVRNINDQLFQKLQRNNIIPVAASAQ